MHDGVVGRGRLFVVGDGMEMSVSVLVSARVLVEELPRASKPILIAVFCVFAVANGGVEDSGAGEGVDASISVFVFARESLEGLPTDSKVLSASDSLVGVPALKEKRL